ncbi:hypothetical protein BGX33_004534, partial [Mortierella sp. NVP41]
MHYNLDPTTDALLKDLAQDQNSHNDYILEDGLLYFQGRIAVPDDTDIKREILSACHDGITAGHFGVFKTCEL